MTKIRIINGVKCRKTLDRTGERCCNCVFGPYPIAFCLPIMSEDDMDGMPCHKYTYEICNSSINKNTKTL